MLVSDVHGVLPYHGEGLAAIIDARRRLLRKGGAMIPERDIVCAALVRERTVARLAAPWRDNVTGLSMDAMWRMVSNAMHSVRLARADLASPPRRAAVLDYRTLASDRLDSRVAWTVPRGIAAQGIALWFDSRLAPGVTLSNAPGRAALIYGQKMLAWPEPVRLRAGEQVRVRVRADRAGVDYVWRWTSEVVDRAGRARVRFDQSTRSWARRFPCASLRPGRGGR